MRSSGDPRRIPHDPVDAGLERNRFVRIAGALVAALEGRVRGLLRQLRRERAQHPGAREDFHRHGVVLLRRVLQPDVEHRAGRPVLARIGARRGVSAIPNGWAGREHVHGRRGQLRLPLAERRQVVEDPERAALGGDDQVVALHDHVGDRDDGQVALERLPVRAVVERDVEAGLGAGVEQAAADRVFAHDAREGRVGDAGDDLRPGLCRSRWSCRCTAAEVVELVHRRRDVGRALVVRRDIDGVDADPLRDALRRDVVPGLPVVAREVDEAVVGARPEHARLVRRLDDEKIVS